MNTLFKCSLLVSLILTAGCLQAEDMYSITASNGVTLDQDMENAKVQNAQEDLWRFQTYSTIFTVSGSGLGDEPAGETDYLETNNTFMHFNVTIDGDRMQLACKIEEDGEGWMKRTKFTETRVAGSFMFVLTYCRDVYTSEPVDYDELPITVEGTFDVERVGF